ncbi:hypothetical protein FS749_007706 [Ceratobasidium sp. UAMH 11750]|nr:hypothetical protein FS749_007706 [Ceratobasidium sp. UAMH 11750]
MPRIECEQAMGRSQVARHPPVHLLAGVGLIVQSAVSRHVVVTSSSTTNGDAFMQQICATIISPSFLTAAMFLSLPRIVDEMGP